MPLPLQRIYDNVLAAYPNAVVYERTETGA
jgi:hypothetical protein